MGIITITMKRDRRRLARLRRKVRGKSGYSIAESLLALLIVALLSIGIAAGVAFGVRQYNEAMSLSEARVLCSTLASVVRGELSVVPEAWTAGDGTVVAFRKSIDRDFSSDEEKEAAQKRNFYAAEITETNSGEAINVKDPGAYGEIVLATNPTKAYPDPVLSSATYSQYKLQANVAIKAEQAGNEVKTFLVTISIRTKDGTERTSETFQVIPLNKVIANDA